MSSKQAACERPDCQWVKTNRNPDIYFCLRCVKEQKLEEKKEPPKPKPNPLPTIIMALAAVLALSFILSSADTQSNRTIYRHEDPW